MGAKALGDFGSKPELLESLARRLRRAEARARLFGTPLDPVRVGKFVLTERLGEGSMGVVYLAHDEQLHRTIALKLLRSSGHARNGTSDGEESRSSLLREAQAMARLSHPNVATVYEAGLWEGRVFIAMELVTGRTLRRWIDDERPSHAEIIGVFIQAGRALVAAHERGIVHRDFKPENVMIGDDGRVRVVDFGLARADAGGVGLGAVKAVQSSDEDSGETALSMSSSLGVAGTPAYMAPEQFRGAPIDGRADQFAFFVALHEALHGARPFPGGSPVEVQESIRRGYSAKLARGAKRIPRWLSRAIARGLSARPEDRWSSMADVVDELSRTRSGALERWLLSSLGAVLIAVVGVVAVRSERSGEDEVPDRNPEAVALFKRAAGHMNDNMADRGDLLRRAAEIDPTFAAPHLYLLLGDVTFVSEAAREHFRAAQAARASLTPYEVLLLEALEPVFNRQPSDWGESARRVREALGRYPHDGILWCQLGESLVHLGDLERGLESFEHALVEQPGLRIAVAEPGYVLLLLGRYEEARAALQACATGRDSNDRCMMLLADLYAVNGDCAALEGIARQMTAQGKGHGEELWLLANALAGQGKPKAAVWESVERAAQHMERDSAALPGPLAPVSRFKAAVWAGDFLAAEGHLADLEQVTKSSGERYLQVGVSTFRAELLLETGHSAEAGDMALQYLEREAAFEPNPTADHTAVVEDTTPTLLAIARRTGRLSRSDYVSRRATWLLGWEPKIAPRYRGALWLIGYADVVADPEMADEAMDALPDYLPLPALDTKSFSFWGRGVAHLLTGDPRGAIPILSRAARSCLGLWVPFQHVRASLYLGQALQQTGDLEGACRSYRTVIERWGSGPVPSVTAEQARDLARGAGCP